MPRADAARGRGVERLLALKALPILGALHADELAVLAEHARPCTFGPGETLFAGDAAPVSRIHLVLDGRVVEERGGRTFRTLGPQQIVGGVDALTHAAADVRAVAAERTRTLAIERAALRDILEDNFGVLGVTLRGVAAATLRLRRRLVPSAGFPAPDAASDPVLPGPLADLGARIEFLDRSTWLRHARVRTLGQIARDAEVATAADGAALWATGDPAEHGVVVASGVVACRTDDGRQRFEVGPGTIVGLEEALAVEPRWCAASAHGPLSFLRIGRGPLVDVLEDDPDTALELLAGLAGVASALADRLAREAAA